MSINVSDMGKVNPNLGYGAYLSGEITPGYSSGSNPITIPEQEADYNYDPQPGQESPATYGMNGSPLSDPTIWAIAGMVAIVYFLRTSGSGRA